MSTNAPSVVDAVNACTAVLNNAAIPGEDMRIAFNRLADALVAASPLADKSVTLAKMADMATASLIYRKTAGTGVPEVTPLATLKTDLGLTFTNSGDSAPKMYLTTGADASGGAVQDTLSDAVIADVVVACINLTDLTDVSADFEAAITVTDKIVQNTSDLSTKKILVLLTRK